MQIDAKLIFENNTEDELFLRVQGTSMQPFLFNGRDTVVLKKPEKIKKGDIVVFRYHGNYVLHRVIKTDGEKFTALGDNLSFPEKDVPVSDIVSKVTAVNRDGKELTPSSLVWLFFSRIYIHQPLRKLFRKIFRLKEKLTERKH